MGGQAQIYVQAVPGSGDFGGTPCWMGQNYGNLGFQYDPANPETRYETPPGIAELDRLHLYRPGTTLSDSQLVRAGDLVEIRARCGLEYNGNMYVNEGHSIDPRVRFRYCRVAEELWAAHGDAA